MIYQLALRTAITYEYARDYSCKGLASRDTRTPHAHATRATPTLIICHQWPTNVGGRFRTTDYM
jgi:hypothetical protein